MSTSVLTLDRRSSAGLDRTRVDVNTLPTIYQRKASVTGGATITLGGNQSTQTDLRLAFPLPGSIELGGVELLQPLPVVLELDEDGTFVLADDVFSRYGAGESPQDAFVDFMNDLATYYDIVAESAAGGSSAALTLLNHMQQYIRRVDH